MLFSQTEKRETGSVRGAVYLSYISGAASAFVAAELSLLLSAPLYRNTDASALEKGLYGSHHPLHAGQ